MSVAFVNRQPARGCHRPRGRSWTTLYTAEACKIVRLPAAKVPPANATVLPTFTASTRPRIQSPGRATPMKFTVMLVVVNGVGGVDDAAAPCPSRTSASVESNPPCTVAREFGVPVVRQQRELKHSALSVTGPIHRADQIEKWTAVHAG